MTLEDIRRVDCQGMYEAVLSFPEQWRAGHRRAAIAELQEVPPAYKYIVVAGMGGSAMGGALLQALVLDDAPVPVFVSRRYQLPAWVGPDTVVIASSYSGTTEETLASLDEALHRNASVFCITTGGTVLERARTEGLPFVQIPGGLQPRAALAASFTAVLTVAEHLGLLAITDDQWEETQAVLEHLAQTLGDPAFSGNQALSLAMALKDKLPFIYSHGGLLEGVNLRWQNQIQENSKTLACGNVFPEQNHNEIMGWERRVDLHKHIGVVVLRDNEDPSRIQRRMEVTRGLLAERAGSWNEVYSQGTSKLARMMSLLYLGDWVSLYLSILHQVDPTPIPLIDQLKRALSG